MAQSRYYSSTAQPTVLVATITPTQTTIQLQQVIGFPVNLPYVLALDYNTSSEELVLVTAIAGTTATITRAFDGTPAASHNVGAGVRHVSCAVDFNDSRNHESLSAGVHGVTGNVVGTTDTQTLSNKTLSSPVINGTVNGAVTTGGVGNSWTFGNGFTVNGNPGVFNAGATFATTPPTFPVGYTAGGSAQLGVNSTGDVTTSGTVQGNNVTATSAVTGATVAATGNATVGGTLNVTGRVNSTGAGQVTAGYVESSTPGTASTNSATYNDTNVTVSTTIVVPPSGKVYISGRVEMFNGTSSVSVWSVINVVGSSSGTLRASTDAHGIEARFNASAGGINFPAHESFVQTATAGETLTIKWQHRTTGGNAGIDYRSISAIPLLG